MQSGFLNGVLSIISACMHTTSEILVGKKCTFDFELKNCGKIVKIVNCMLRMKSFQIKLQL